MLPAGTHLHRRRVDRLQPRRAETVELHPRCVHIPAGAKRGRARNVAALLANRRDAAEHDVVDVGCVQVGALCKRVEKRDEQIDRRHGVQRTVGLAAPARGANRVVDIGLGWHGELSFCES
jgi:hypothetical protein